MVRNAMNSGGLVRQCIGWPAFTVKLAAVSSTARRQCVVNTCEGRKCGDMGSGYAIYRPSSRSKSPFSSKLMGSIAVTVST
jgi:hypothetical protein